MNFYFDLFKMFEKDSREHIELTFIAICKYLIDRQGAVHLRSVLKYCSYPDEFENMEQWLEIKDIENLKKYLGMLGSEYDRYVNGG